VRAAFLDEPHRFGIREQALPAPTAGEALVRVRAVGICGTDVSIAAGKIPVETPRVLGHEVVGDLVVVGDSAIEPGATVLVDPGLSCGRCPQCREGRTNICTRAGLLGRDHDGGLRELLPVPSTHVHTVPASIDPLVAPLLQVLATCVHAQRLVPIRPADRVAVLGLGVTGLLHVQLAAHRGATVTGITRSATKRELAVSLGAERTIAPNGDGGSDFDVVIESAGLVETLARAIDLSRVGGRILAYGTIGRSAEGPLPFYELYYKELTLVGARSARPEDFVTSIALAADGRVQLEPLVSDRFGLDQTATAFTTAASSSTLKVLIDV
jgi:L-iditol 2-dehydrogenase